MNPVKMALARAFDVRDGEWSALAASFGMFFAVLASYFTVRPVREAVGASLPKGALADLFTVVFVVMIALVPVFGLIATRLPRRFVLPLVYAVFITNLAVFSVALRGELTPLWASAFFVWVSVYNLFVVSLFWSLMSRCWSSEQAKRLFGVIAAGGTIGALVGPVIADRLVGVLGTANLALVSAGFLAVALAASLGLERRAGLTEAADIKPPLTLAAMLEGATRVFQSPYLGRIALFIALANLVSTLFYLEQSRLVKETILDRNAQVSFFASRDLMVSVATAAIQLFGTARILAAVGLTGALAALPIVCIGGLATIGLVPTLSAVAAVMVVERVTAFALAGPAMRVLYTVVDPAEKYKAQNFTDTVVYRGGDAAAGWLFRTTGQLGLSVFSTAAVTLPFAAFWLVTSLRLGSMKPDLKPAPAVARPS